MGEQGAKTLRGGKMEDVIFAGAGARKPLGRAEVTLTIDNSDGALPIEYTEVSVTRRMFRDGASEYEINGSRARLMDIQELLSDSGIGREMHVIVGQGRLAEILESRPEERRAFIEEAAGVLKHRRRKEKAQRKLTGMQANLDRLTDLTEELQRQLKPLARQAAAAQRAATVQAELRDARLKLAGAQLVTLATQRDDAYQSAETLSAHVREIEAALQQRNRAQQEAEEQLSQIIPKAERAQELWFELSALAERVSATERIAQDRARNFTEVPYSGQNPEELEQRAAQADIEQAALDAAVESAREQLQEIREKVVECEDASREADREHMAQVRALADRREGVLRLLAAEESQASQVAAAEVDIERQSELLEETLSRTIVAKQEAEHVQHQLAQLGKERAGIEHKADAARNESSQAEARLNELNNVRLELEKSISRIDSRIETLRESLPAANNDSIFDDVTPLVNLIHTEDQYVAALAAALGAHARALVADEFDAESVSGADIARTVVMTSSQQPTWRLDVQLPPGTHWLLDVLELQDEVVGPITRLLVDVVLVSSITQAQEIIETDPRLRAVTHNGELCGEGWVEFGTGSTTPVEVTAEIASDTEILEGLRAELADISGTLTGARSSAEEARMAVATAQTALREHDTKTKALQREHQRLANHTEFAQQEHDRAANRLTQTSVRLKELHQQLAETRDRLARVEHDDEQEPSTEARDKAAFELSKIKALEIEARLALRTAEERAGVTRGKADNLRRQAEQERHNQAKHEENMARLRADADLAATVAQCSQKIHQRVSAAIDEAAARRDTCVARRREAQERFEQEKASVNELRVELSRVTDKAHATDIARHQAQVRFEEAETKLSEQLGLPADVIRNDYAPDETFDRSKETARLKQAEKDLASLGKVNPLALEEFKAMEERYEYLAGQLNDVEQARRDLTDVIEEVDAKILQLFTEAWRDVEMQFPDVFGTLFPGGEGRLVLTEPDDMLTTGIEVEARPPGKKVKRLSLLSGGEKSLTALALLVAIFKARPSPFYVMDEVEAALDDVNLRRLIALFRELRNDSQLILITHQKPTMEVANVLYGMTMQGDGITKVISQRMSPG